jgi:hypothetical protein
MPFVLYYDGVNICVQVAEHIARERTEAVGQSTGYHIRYTFGPENCIKCNVLFTGGVVV